MSLIKTNLHRFSSEKHQSKVVQVRRNGPENNHVNIVESLAARYRNIRIKHRETARILHAQFFDDLNDLLAPDPIEASTGAIVNSHHLLPTNKQTFITSKTIFFI